MYFSRCFCSPPHICPMTAMPHSTEGVGMEVLRSSHKLRSAQIVRLSIWQFGVRVQPNLCQAKVCPQFVFLWRLKTRIRHFIFWTICATPPYVPHVWPFRPKGQGFFLLLRFLRGPPYFFWTSKVNMNQAPKKIVQISEKDLYVCLFRRGAINKVCVRW